MMPQEPSDIKARIPRIIIVTISDWAIICKTGTVLFKTTSKILFFFTEYGYKIQKHKNKKSSIHTFFNKCKKSTSLAKYFCILKSHKQNGLISKEIKNEKIIRMPRSCRTLRWLLQQPTSTNSRSKSSKSSRRNADDQEELHQAAHSGRLWHWRICR